MSSEARRRLAAVHDLAEGSLAPSVTARSTVWLLRLALEHAMSDLWVAHGLSFDETSMKRQLLVLPHYLDAEEAWRVAELWSVLSRAAHHHTYELAPTRSEVLTWKRDVETAVGALENGADVAGPDPGHGWFTR